MLFIYLYKKMNNSKSHKNKMLPINLMIYMILIQSSLVASQILSQQQGIPLSVSSSAIYSNGPSINPSMSMSGEYRLPSRMCRTNAALIAERQRLMYPYEGYLTDISSGKPIHDQSLQFRLPFFGFSYEYIWIQRDGYIAFNKGLQTYRFPLHLPIQPSDTFVQEDPALLAPFFAIQDISPDIPGSGVYFQLVNMADTRGYYDQEYETLRERLFCDFSEGMIGATDFQPKWSLIITWANMTMANMRSERPMRTNTFQAIIATDEIRTYAMFNYEQIDWVTHMDNYDGLKGSAAFVGFNAGNTTRSFEFKPYSQHQRVSMLPSGGFGNGLRGRYFFQVDEEIWPGSCIDKKLEPNLQDRLPLTFFPRYGHMLGGTLVDVTGPCLDQHSIIYCRFDNFKSEAVYRSHNHATCISPAFMYHGYVDLIISVDDRIEFVGRFYVQPPEVADDDVIVLDGKDREESPDQLELKWHPQKLSWQNDSAVTISLWGYRETMNVYPQLTYITTLAQGGARLGQAQYNLDLNQFRDRDDGPNTDILFGFIAINVTDPRRIAPNLRQSPTIWSRPMPLSWYFRAQWLRAIGDNYKDYFCKNWYEREASADRFAATVWRCPCTLAQVNIDRGRFSPDLQCNIIDRRCDTFHKEALHCVNTGRPSIGGSGQTCCYDDQGELIQTADTLYGGRPSRAFIYGKHPFKIRMMIPSLSTWVHDVAPFFYCCAWQTKKDNAEACQNYNQFRASQDCSLYQPPVVASVYGDPHFITFNKNNYTFNGKGEYVLVHTDSPKVKFDVQGRFEQVPRQFRHMQNIRATQLTAVAAQDNFSSIVEFRIRPLAARWRYHIYVLVDNVYVFWWDKSMQVQNFRGVTLYQPAGIQNMSHIIAMFDSGAGVEVMSIDGYMTAHIYLPADFQSITKGLLGNYSRSGAQSALGDLVSPTGMLQNTKLPMEQLHKFGQSWRLTENDRIGIGHTLFSHTSVRYALYDDQNFEPQFRFDSYDSLSSNGMSLGNWWESPAKIAEMLSICSDSQSCIYDFKVSYGNKDLAIATKRFEAIAFELADVASREVVRCPALPKPANGMKSENRYWPGKVVRFSCDVGYRLIGYEARYCREDGLWSWGEDPQCISDWHYFFIMFGSVMAALLPLLITIAAGIFCIIYMVRRSRSHYTNERKDIGSADDNEEEEDAEDFKVDTISPGTSLRPQKSPKPSTSNIVRRGIDQNDEPMDFESELSSPSTGLNNFRTTSKRINRSGTPPPRLPPPPPPPSVSRNQTTRDRDSEADDLDIDMNEDGDFEDELNEDLSQYNDRRAPNARAEEDDFIDDGSDRMDKPTTFDTRTTTRTRSPGRPFRPLSTRSIFDDLPSGSGITTSSVYMPTTTTSNPRQAKDQAQFDARANRSILGNDDRNQSESRIGLPLRPKSSNLRRTDYGPMREARI